MFVMHFSLFIYLFVFCEAVCTFSLVFFTIQLLSLTISPVFFTIQLLSLTISPVFSPYSCYLSISPVFSPYSCYLSQLAPSFHHTAVISYDLQLISKFICLCVI
jgi:hypothetical protein